MDDSLKMRQQVSDLMDGRIAEPEFSHATQAVLNDDEALQAWRSYHVVAEALRGGASTVGVDDGDFLRRFQQRLQAQPAVYAATFAAMELPPARERRDEPAANEARFRWAWSAGFACLLVAAFVGWRGLGASDPAGGAALALQDANPTSTVQIQSEPQIMLRDPRLDQLLMLHRQTNSASALPASAGFLRNATFEVPARADLPK